jgi:hypothetical protein
VRSYAIAGFDKVGEDGAVALVLEKVTGEDGLHVDQTNTVEISF